MTTERHALTDQPVKIRNSNSAGREQKPALGGFGVLRTLQHAICGHQGQSDESVTDLTNAADRQTFLNTSGERDALAPGCGAQLPNKIGLPVGVRGIPTAPEGARGKPRRIYSGRRPTSL